MTYRYLVRCFVLSSATALAHCADGATNPVVDAPPTTDTDAVAVPHLAAWEASPHANASAPAFTHWSVEGVVPTTCARCHSSEGYIDYLGGDGTSAGTVERQAPAGSVVRCVTCHDPAASALTSVTFPSGAVVSDLGPEARCMVCHQGRASGADIDASIAKAAPATDDTTSTDLGFSSIHYFPAAATLFAGIAKGGYQYAGQTYDVRFRHVAGFNTCVGCHDAHSTKVKIDECAACHTAVTDNASLRDIRMIASRNQDYDGDGDTAEGIAHEISGLRDKLLAVIERYGAERATRLCFGSDYPYWFNDTSGNDTCEAGELDASNGFNAWTPRLLRAAYNYQVGGTDPGNFAHNAKYTIELLYDSVVDLNSGLSAPLDVSRLVRTDQGHFNGAGEPARHWDTADEGVSASCSRCHSGSEGFRFFTQYGVGKAVPEQDNGLDCATCHRSFAPDYSIDVPARVYLADGGTTSFDPTPADGDPGSDNSDNLCANCHIGRQNGATIEAAIAAAPPAGVSSFVNVHYDFAAATRAGSKLGVGSQTPENTYAGTLAHVGGVECTTCHDPVASNHTFAIADVWPGRCAVCHGDASGPRDIRPVSRSDDFDGDGNVVESLASELDGSAARLLVAMRASVTTGVKPCYDAETNPYWFKDTDGGSPQCDATEAVSANAYRPWPAALLRAAHNYQVSRKDPGAYAHNFSYVDELLFDSIVALGGSTSGMTRP